MNLEAMAAGLPIVTAYVGRIPDIVEEGVNGYLVNAKRPADISGRILMLLRNDKNREEISANNREKTKLYEWDKVALKAEKEYQRAILRSMDSGITKFRRVH